MKNNIYPVEGKLVQPVSSLKALLESKECIRILEAHSPLSALIAESLEVKDKSGEIVEYDGFWSSSLTDSTLIGKPDIEILDVRERLNTVTKVFDVTTKPLILDADTGGLVDHFEINVRLMSRRGVSAVIIEDKMGLKKNSLLGNDVFQQLADPKEFAEKIRRGRLAKVNDDFMIIARIESLILEFGMDEALSRADTYIEAGVDGIMIHSRQKDGNEIIEFAKLFRLKHSDIPLVCVPTSFNHLTFEELTKAGFNVVIYANHMLRASYNAMNNVATDILFNGRTLESEGQCLSVKEILKLIPGTA